MKQKYRWKHTVHSKIYRVSLAIHDFIAKTNEEDKQKRRRRREKANANL